MKKIKIGIVILLIVVICFISYNRYNEGKDINVFLNDFLNNEKYVSYYASINITSSEKSVIYTTMDKNFIYDLFSYLMSFNTKKYNNIPKDKINELKNSDISITILAKDSQNISNTIIIDIDYSNLYSIQNNYNKKYDNKYYYLNKNFDNTIISLVEKYDMNQVE